MSDRLKQFTDDMATVAIQKLGIDFTKEKFTEEQFREGTKHEYMEHLKTIDGEVTMAGRIAIDHLSEFPSYYEMLADMEAEALSPIDGDDSDLRLPMFDDEGDEGDLNVDPTQVRGKLTRRKRKSDVGAPSMIKSFQNWSDENPDSHTEHIQGSLS